MKKLISLGALVVLSAIALAAGSAVAAPGGGAASGWHIGYYTSSGQTLSFAQAPNAAPDGLAYLNFTDQPNTALLTTTQKAQFPSLLGDLSGKTVDAHFTITDVSSTASFIFGGPNYCGTNTSFVRYFFETSNAGSFDETHYWWSNPVHYNLVGNGAVDLTPVALNGANWSDFYGHFGTGSYADGFNAAVSNVTEIGLSFGGDCFFENGVGTTDGSGTFTLNSYTTSP